MVKLGLLRNSEDRSEANIYTSQVPSFRLGDVLPLFLGASTEDLVHRFLDAVKYEAGDPVPLMLLQLRLRPTLQFPPLLPIQAM